MILIEPENVYRLREGQRQHCERHVVYGPVTSSAGANFGRGRGVDECVELTLGMVRDNGDEPVAITTVANALARRANVSCRTEREALKLRAFQIIADLIRSGRLIRLHRRYVTVAQPARA